MTHAPAHQGLDWNRFSWYYDLFYHPEQLEAAMRAISSDGELSARSEAAGTLDFIDNPLAAHSILDTFDLDGSSHVVDMGCGLGGPTRLYASTGARVTGVDLLEEQVRAHKRLNEQLGIQNITVIVGDAEHVPLPDESFTHYFSIGALCHTYNRTAALKEAHRILKPNGHLAIIDFHEGPEPGPEFFGGGFWHLIPGDHYRELIKAAGFHNVFVRDLRLDYLEQVKLYMEIMVRSRAIFEIRFGGKRRFAEALATYRAFEQGFEQGRLTVSWFQGIRPA